jgi:hypothetical protein
MKKLVYSALALSVTSAGALASDTDWSTLDQEIEALTASTSLDNHGPHIGGRIRTWYESSENDTGGDNGDFDVVDARVHAAGSHGDYAYKVQVDFAGEPNLLDAYVDFAIGGQVNARMGQFKAGVSRSALISSGNLFFTDRNNAGSSWANRTEGLMLSGDFDQLGWSLGFMDGDDAAGDEYLMTAKVDFDVMGDGAGDVEGAYGGSESPSLTIGIGMWDDGGNDADGTIIEVHGGTNVWSIGIDMQDDGATDSSPTSIMGTYMLQPDTWELGVRLEDEDNASDESTMTIGVNNYLDGHGLKWGFEMASTSSDDEDDETDTIRISLNCAF